MKLFFVICVLLFLLIQCASFSEEKTDIVVSVLADQTDTDIPAPKFIEIESLLQQTTGNKYVRYQNITHTGTNPVHELSLPAPSMWNNQLEEKKKEDSFYQSLNKFLRQRKDSIQYSNSSIITPLVREIEYLSTQPQEKKTILLYSNLFEANDVILNVYTPQGKEQLSQLDRLITDWDQALDVPHSKIDLHIIYYPTSTEESTMFDQLFKLYQHVLEPKGITLHRGLPTLIDSI